MIADQMDSQRYLDRINYAGPTAPAAGTLRALHLAHLRSVPFENLDIHLGRPIRLDRAALYEKFVLNRRGGFCYEQNGLFSWLLQQLGFDVTLLEASVMGDDGRFGPPFDHLTLRVLCPADPDQPALPWLADVGFGDSFRQPLRLDRLGVPQQEGARAYQIDEADGSLLLQQREPDGKWEKQYRFTRQPRRLADFAEMCMYHQTSPHSHFTQRRVCSLATANGRLTLSEQKLIITESGKRRERVVGEDEYQTLLEECFVIKLDKERYIAVLPLKKSWCSSYVVREREVKLQVHSEGSCLAAVSI